MGTCWLVPYFLYGDICWYFTLHIISDVVAGIIIHLPLPGPCDEHYKRYMSALKQLNSEKKQRSNESAVMLDQHDMDQHVMLTHRQQYISGMARLILCLLAAFVTLTLTHSGLFFPFR